MTFSEKVATVTACRCAAAALESPRARVQKPPRLRSTFSFSSYIIRDIKILNITRALHSAKTLSKMVAASSSSSAPLVTVVGATGAQGGSVVTHLLASKKEYRIRAITRDPTKSNAKALSDKGVEVVKGDFDNVESIKSAFKGADIAFGVTNFWATMDANKEVEDGKMLVDAAKDAGVKLFVWSGLEPVKKITKGKFDKVSHFDSKAAVTEYAKSTGLPFANVQPGFYSSNLATQMVPRKQEDGSFALMLPFSAKSVVPVLDTERDYGAYVVEAIESPSFGAGSEVLAAAEYISISDIVKGISKVSGKDVKHVEVNDEQFVQFVPHGGEELVHMLRYFQEFGYYGGKDIEPSQKDLTSPVNTFEDYAKTVNWDKILI